MPPEQTSNDVTAQSLPPSPGASTDAAHSFPPNARTAEGVMDGRDVEKDAGPRETPARVADEDGGTEVTEFAVIKDAIGLGQEQPAEDAEKGHGAAAQQEMSEKPADRPVSMASTIRRRRPTTDPQDAPSVHQPDPAHLREGADRRASAAARPSSVGASAHTGDPRRGSVAVGKGRPKTVLRIERNWSAGGSTNGMVQFWDGWLEELDGRISPLDFQNTLNELNATLASAYSRPFQFLDGVLEVLTGYLWPWLIGTHYKRQIRTFAKIIERQNRDVFNPAGLNLLHPRQVGYMFMEVELY